MSKQTPDEYFSVKKLAKRAKTRGRVKAVRTTDARADVKPLKARLRRK